MQHVLVESDEWKGCRSMTDSRYVGVTPGGGWQVLYAYRDEDGEIATHLVPVIGWTLETQTWETRSHSPETLAFAIPLVRGFVNARVGIQAEDAYEGAHEWMVAVLAPGEDPRRWQTEAVDVVKSHEEAERRGRR